jgi:hypothetical protein
LFLVSGPQQFRKRTDGFFEFRIDLQRGPSSHSMDLDQVVELRAFFGLPLLDWFPGVIKEGEGENIVDPHICIISALVSRNSNETGRQACPKRAFFGCRFPPDGPFLGRLLQQSEQAIQFVIRWHEEPPVHPLHSRCCK